jgi:hypothetical protein
MKMDGYDVIRDIEFLFTGRGKKDYTIYRVYTLKRGNNRTIKHYRNSYSNYQEMIKHHPELV